jgi:hypothetical protein
MSEPARPVQPVSPGAPVPPAATPVTPSSRPERAGAAEEPFRRKLLIGAALLLALASIYAGVFNVGRVAQIVLAAAATMAMVLALTSNNRRRNS